MSLVGYSLVAPDGSIMKTWPAVPQRLDLPGLVIVHAPALGPQPGGHRLVECHEANPDPGDGSVAVSYGEVYDEVADRVTRTSVWRLPVPQQVTIFQARAALRAAELFTAAEAAITALQNVEATDAWARASVVTRTSALVNSLGPQLGLTDQQIDDLFRAAAVIEV